MNPITGIISKITGEKTADVITSIGNTVGQFIQTKEEKEKAMLEVTKEVNRHMETLASETTKELSVYMADMASAREMNAKIQDSEKASWLAKNIAYAIDCVFVLAFILMLIMIFNRAVPESNKELFYTGFGLLGGYVGTILNFHRGTSKGSENKQKQIDRIINR